MGKQGTVVAICICPTAGGEMRLAQEAKAIVGKGLEGDRYATGEGSWNKNAPGKRQVTLMNTRFFRGSGWSYAESRRNLFIEGIDLMRLINEEFTLGEARLYGVEYCYPCERPGVLCGKPDFDKAFEDCGGLIAEVRYTGVIRLNSLLIPSSF